MKDSPSCSRSTTISPRDEKDGSDWFVYLVRCNDHSLYTGITTDPPRRLKEHNSPDSSTRYTRARQPVKLVYLETAAHRSGASSREYAIKKMNKQAKEHLIASEANRYFKAITDI